MFGMKQGKGSAQVEHAACGCPVCPAPPGVFSWKLDRGNQRPLQLAEFAGRDQWAVRGVPHLSQGYGSPRTASKRLARSRLFTFTAAS